MACPLRRRRKKKHKRRKDDVTKHKFVGDEDEEHTRALTKADAGEAADGSSKQEDDAEAEDEALRMGLELGLTPAQIAFERNKKKRVVPARMNLSTAFIRSLASTPWYVPI